MRTKIFQNFLLKKPFFYSLQSLILHASNIESCLHLIQPLILTRKFAFVDQSNLSSIQSIFPLIPLHIYPSFLSDFQNKNIIHFRDDHHLTR